MFELRPADEARLAAPGEVDGPPDARGHPPDANRLAAGAAAAGTSRDDADRRRRAGPRLRGRARTRPAERRGRERDRRGAARGAGRRLPDLSALPPLLADDRVVRLAPRAAGRARGGHVGLTSIPHGAKSFLAAAIALAEGGERLVWIARDAEIGDRVAEELQAWLG